MEVKIRGKGALIVESDVAHLYRGESKLCQAAQEMSEVTWPTNDAGKGCALWCHGPQSAPDQCYLEVSMARSTATEAAPIARAEAIRSSRRLARIPNTVGSKDPCPIVCICEMHKTPTLRLSIPARNKGSRPEQPSIHAGTIDWPW